MISIEGLVFDYPSQRALFGIDLSIEPGGIVALVGPNGAGKSTLMRCLVGLRRPTSGRVLFEGQDVHAQSRANHSAIGFLPDFFGLYEDLSVHRCLSYAAAARRVPDADIPDRVREVAAYVNLSDRLEQKGETLSRGMKQRLAIGQAILHRPRLLVLDEPASGLDPDARTALSGLFKRLQGDGMTLIVSSHILSELEDYATHMVVMRDGRVIDQRPVGVGGETRRIRIETADRGEDLAVFLKTRTGEVVETGATHAIIEIADDDEAQMALLTALSATGLPVLEFRRSVERMADAYDRSMRRLERGAA